MLSAGSDLRNPPNQRFEVNYKNNNLTRPRSLTGSLFSRWSGTAAAGPARPGQPGDVISQPGDVAAQLRDVTGRGAEGDQPGGGVQLGDPAGAARAGPVPGRRRPGLGGVQRRRRRRRRRRRGGDLSAAAAARSGRCRVGRVMCCVRHGVCMI